MVGAVGRGSRQLHACGGRQVPAIAAWRAAAPLPAAEGMGRSAGVARGVATVRDPRPAGRLAPPGMGAPGGGR